MQSQNKEQLVEVSGIINQAEYFNIPEVRKALHVPDYVPVFEMANRLTSEVYVFNKEGSGVIN